jgi:hypothetical protein
LILSLFSHKELFPNETKTAARAQMPGLFFTPLEQGLRRYVAVALFSPQSLRLSLILETNSSFWEICWQVFGGNKRHNIIQE